MNKSCSVVIGSSFGDEGKGLITDYLANQTDNCCIVRFSSGSQAGHTVVTPEGKRHVFHHMGSGTLAGAATFLSQYFISNPIIFMKEYLELKELGIEPRIYVHPDSPITTPYDMILNQIKEVRRGKNRHGSCGIGINETIHRNVTYPLYVADLNYEEMVINRVKSIRNEYLPNYLAEDGIDLPEDFKDGLLYSKKLFDNYIEDCFKFRDLIATTKYPTILHKNLIFEGSQGLRLDQDSKYYPYVTHAKTGLNNVIKLAKDYKIEKLDVYYVTRPYITRHGAGPLPYELKTLPYPQIKDDTNLTNPWQGQLRFAFLEPEELFQFIYDDLDSTEGMVTAKDAHLVMTCIDQLDGYFYYIDKSNGGAIKFLPSKEFLSSILNAYWPGDMLFSQGPTRDDIYVV